MHLSKQQSFLLALHLAGLVAGNAPPLSAGPSLEVPSLNDIPSSVVQIIEESYAPLPLSSPAEFLERRGNPKTTHSSKSTSTPRRSSSTRHHTKPAGPKPTTHEHADPTTSKVTPAGPKKSPTSAPPAKHTTSRAGSGGPPPAGPHSNKSSKISTATHSTSTDSDDAPGNHHPGSNHPAKPTTTKHSKASSAAHSTSTDSDDAPGNSPGKHSTTSTGSDGHHPASSKHHKASSHVQSTSTDKDDTHGNHPNKHSTTSTGSGSHKTSTTDDSSPTHDHSKSASPSPGVTKPPRTTGTGASSAAGPAKTSLEISDGDSMITPVYHATTYPEYASLASATTVTTTDGGHHPVPIVIWPHGRGWKCVVACGSPGKPNAPKIPFPTIKPPKGNTPSGNGEGDGEGDGDNDPDDDDHSSTKSSEESTSSESTKSESSSSTPSSSAEPTQFIETAFIDDFVIATAPGAAAAMDKLKSQWDEIGASASSASKGRSTLSSRPATTTSKDDDGNGHGGHGGGPAPTSSTEATTTADPTTTTDDGIIHKPSTSTSDGATFTWASQTVTKDGDKTKTVGAGPKGTVLPEVKDDDVTSKGLSANCYLIDGDCDDAAHQFIEDGWASKELKSKTARYHKFNGSLISAACIVQFKCEKDEDYDAGLSGRQVYDM